MEFRRVLFRSCSYYVLMSQEPPSPPAGHPDPRTLRLFDLAPHEAILVRCECGRMAYATDVFWKVDLAKLFSIPVRTPVPVDQRGEARPTVGRQCRPEKDRKSTRLNSSH